MSLIPFESLQRNYERYLQQQEQAHVKTAEILLEVAVEFAPVTVAELAEASGMSASWVRKTLRAAGITPAKPVRQKQQEEVQP